FSSVGPAIVMPAIIGYKKARELLYFGDAIDAETARSLGMVNRVVPLAELRAAGLAWAKRLTLVSPEALYATKLAINRGADAAGDVVALLPVEARRLEVQCEQRDEGAAAAPAFLFGHRENAGTEAITAPRLGQEEPLDEQNAKRAAAIEAADDLAGLGVGDQ